MRQKHNSAERKRMERTRRAAPAVPQDARTLLQKIYDGNGSRLTLNSSRLRTLDATTQAEAYDRAVADTMEDLKRFVHVDIQDKARCVASYIANTDDESHVMHVCGVCGMRDPEVTYTEVYLHLIPAGSWLEGRCRRMCCGASRRCPSSPC